MSDAGKIRQILGRLQTVEDTTPDFMWRTQGEYLARTLISDIRRIASEPNSEPQERKE